MSKRTNRASYPDYVKYVTRFNAGDLQKNAGIPASLINKARKGEVENFSEKTLEKFKAVYTAYWESRLDKAGIPPDNWQPIIKQHELKEVKEIVRSYEDNKKLDRRLDRGGVNPIEREKIIQYSTPKEIENIIDKNQETAEIIAARRRERDKNLPGYNDSWHTAKDVLKQMARDTSRIPSDWLWIAKNGSPKRKNKWKPETGKRGRRGGQYQH